MLILQRQIIKNPTPTLTLPLKGRGFYGVFSLHGGILWGFLTFMEGFPIPPLSRGRSGGGWGIYVAVVLRKFLILSLFLCILQANPSLGFETKGQDCAKCHTLNNDEARNLLKDIIPNLKVLGVNPSQVKGFWEVYLESGGRKGLIYVDFPKKHFISGSLLLISEKKNLTQERLMDLNRVDVSQIPLEDALVMGDPKAKIKIVAFDDPD